MTIERMIELLEIERSCIMRNIRGECDRNCGDCDLVQKDTDLGEMYTSVIGILKEKLHPLFYVRDKVHGRIHGFGEDVHDSVWVDEEGTFRYYNLQNGDGCGSKSVLDNHAGYEFCPMDEGRIDPEYLKAHKSGDINDRAGRVN